MASTLLARSWSRLPRRPVVASPGYRSFSVRKARPAPGEARGQRRGGDAEVRVRGQEGLDAVGLGVGRDAELVEHLHQRLAAAGGIGAQQQAALASLDQRAQLGDRILGAARHADVGRGAEIGMRLAGGERQAAEILQLAVQRFRVRNSADGGSTGRSRSLLRKPYRLAVSWPKRCMASSMSPTVTVTVSSAR